MKSKPFAILAIAVMSLTSLAACGGATSGGSSTKSALGHPRRFCQRDHQCELRR